ncbi:DoxX family protein [Nonlabens ponticola]|uniref:DoxX family membrane protein n=1 Tax=Nonlabens ponticola TaxID=2496866 RepID=A0A3S9MZ08_9FLAO|nr:hypothetical protein [Nonlabens ponticola]AZQ44293.1 hypothetical protein EJ995_08615 [Nonlabens ponticola]
MNWSKVSVFAFIIFYGVAGVVHFVNPEVYFPVIPDWLGDPAIINYLAGATELLVAILVIFNRTRKTAGLLAVAMLLAFTISHIYFIMNDSCAGDLCLDPWIGWARLIVIHPLLIWWAYGVSKYGGARL